MHDYCGWFYFAKDMNRDGIFTVTDLLLMAKFVYFLPAKIMVGLIADMPSTATFFEIDCNTGQSWGGGIFAFFAWIFLIALLQQMYEGNRN